MSNMKATRNRENTLAASCHSPLPSGCPHRLRFTLAVKKGISSRDRHPKRLLAQRGPSETWLSDPKRIPKPKASSNKCFTSSNKCLTSSNKCLTSSNKCLTSSNKCLTSSNKCLTSSNKCLTSSNKCLTSSNKCLTSSNKCLTSSNKCLTSSNKCLTSSNNYKFELN